MNPKIVEIVARGIFKTDNLTFSGSTTTEMANLAKGALTALSQAGYVVVPRKATPEMVEAAWAAALAENAGEVWDDMMDECLKENTDGTP